MLIVDLLCVICRHNPFGGGIVKFLVDMTGILMIAQEAPGSMSNVEIGVLKPISFLFPDMALDTVMPVALVFMAWIFFADCMFLNSTQGML